MDENKRVGVAILAGGASRRMGTDKALMRFPPNGPTILERVITAAAPIASELVVVAPEGRKYPTAGARVVIDRYPGEGPLGGIVTAFSATTSDHLVVLACDAPLLSAALLRWLADYPGAGALVPRTADGQLHPLLARYPRAAALIFERAFAAGERRLQVAVRGLAPQFVAEDQLRRSDPDLRSFINVNSPDEYSRALQLLTDSPSPSGGGYTDPD